MYVQTTAARIDHFHRDTPFYHAALDASKKRKSPTRALHNFWRLQFVVLPSVPVILVCGLCERQSETTSTANAAAQTLRHLWPIFILRCGSPRAMIYSYRNAPANAGALLGFPRRRGRSKVPRRGQHADRAFACTLLCSAPRQR